MQHQCHVVTDSVHAEVRIPAFVAKLHSAHLARLQRFKVAAIGERAIVVAEVDDAQVALLEKQVVILETWESRQKKKFKPKPAPDDLPIFPTISAIQSACCMYFNIPKVDILSARRTRDLSFPRQIAMYLARTLTNRGYPEIGRRFGGRDHTTIIHAANKIADLIKSDWTVAYDIAKLEAML